MKKFLSTRPIATDFALLAMRVIFGGFMVIHGWGKLMKLTGGGQIKFYDIGIGPEASLALTVFSELVCSSFIILGLFTRFATIPLIITMLVAVFGAHANDILKEGEHAFLFLAAFTGLFFIGPGKYSVDNKLFK